MIIKNYTQFAKKTYWLGMDRSFVGLSFLSFASILAVIIVLDYNPIPFFGMVVIFYIISIISFKRSPYGLKSSLLKQLWSRNINIPLKKIN